ncbi:C2H2 transcription factor [Metarhizium rileyi]|uniref:C2H2 transcription factor n=1 Tax=Metarhizium rileyi (strain RCEF 4871) TaxID=1649241 RepID=A0A166Y326_METRR|nr:C2H2 transcription factor [Metarhizium rileyi RCEF 4871]
MAGAFRPVNSSLLGESIKEEPMTTSSSSSVTPRPSTASQRPPQPQLSYNTPDDSKTPTRSILNSGAPESKPLANNASFPLAGQAADTADYMPRRENSQHSTKSSRRDSMDVDMDDSDGETGIGCDDGTVSDGDSVGADGSKSNKKKKSQRFYCTDYPPCNLSFTRSEHLARHIRKHTGERPFQCHCSRRFSRLDNLRQHAQTVHVNEDIPMDSLAATGSRFQRQMRSAERARQAGNRARASTGGSAGGPARGHSKSLSTSSIASINSVGSAYGLQADARRRPPPLVMATDPRSRMSLESYRSNADSTYSYRPSSPGDFSTPTSATFSTAQSSPRWASGLASPTSAHSRSHSMYSTGHRTPGRRLSVPSSANPFQTAPARPVFAHGHINSSHPAVFSPAASNLVPSPTSSTSGWSTTRRDSVSSNGDEAWRRRTWHPDSRNYGNQPPQTQPNQLAGVNQNVGPNPPPPIANPSNSQSSLRLPGIESFDPIPRRHPTPPPPPPQQQQQQGRPSVMVIDSESAYRRPFQSGICETIQPDERRNLNMYDASLQRGLNRLDISHKTPPRDGAGSWASEANRAVQAQGERVQTQVSQPSVRFEDQVPPSRQFPSSVHSGRSLHQHTMSAPLIATPRENKRHGWYNGPAPAQAAVGHVVHDARGAHVERMVHPNFTGFSGFPVREQQAQPPQQDGQRNPESLRRLEALVAVATSEGTTATAY